MPWYINILVGIIIGGIIFNAKMRKSFMGFLDGFMKSGKKKKVDTASRYVTVDGKRYKLEEDDET
jgi:hypothetical protein